MMIVKNWIAKTGGFNESGQDSCKRKQERDNIRHENLREAPPVLRIMNI